MWFSLKSIGMFKVLKCVSAILWYLRRDLEQKLKVILLQNIKIQIFDFENFAILHI